MKMAQLQPQRRNIKLLLDILEAVVEARIGRRIFVPNDAQRFARPERDADEVAGGEFDPVRHSVGVRMIERDRNEDVDDAPCHGGSVRFAT